MKFIDYNIDDIELPDGWTDKANELTSKLIIETSSEERKKIIKANSKHWGLLKSKLAEISNGKCWYTEAKQEGTDTDVDHFRPKNSVSEGNKKNDGYWWLAFDPKNYRYSCISANRRRTDKKTEITGGKGDHFPLCNPHKRAISPAHDLDEELPELLDPCDEVDVMQITYADNGEALASHSKDKNLRQYQRAIKSINIYNLNHSDFKEARIELRNKLSKFKTDAEKNYKKLETGDAAHKEAYRQAIRNIKACLKPEQPYSRFCRDYIEPFSRTDECLKGIFT
uniref:TIGR02646 family protein n=1 Tax=OCS116 cluster bacterium TaxID=2030921 RepID=A0A2A4Z030_9PROT